MYDAGFSTQTVRTFLLCATGNHDEVDADAIRESVTQMRDELASRISELTTTRETLTRFLEQGWT
ncbi:hypothetical protein [Amycolatopsis sp. GM8]|uniref:hypothetical protein n=1 Tax=Amycolatopsis sp. GM8 TaxID=2896530 RepID=UPI001F431FF4|nr:hypothetical protein [Amycolatopsis sp. GM8]